MRGSTAVLQRRAAPAYLVTAGAVALVTIATLALAYVVYALWPRWPDAPRETDAPTLPIIIGDVLFQVPQAAIRQKVQRRSGAQERVDLAFLWPSLEPSAPTRAATMVPAVAAAQRLFMGIVAAPMNMTPSERLRTIYPRYLEPTMWPGPAGLNSVAFRVDGPYRGEDLFYDRQSPDRFMARCTRDTALTPGSCLTERVVGPTTITVRFARAWVDDWQTVVAGIDTIIERMQPAGR